MSRAPHDEERDERIHNEAVVVDAYGPEKQSIGWWVYLDERLGAPFRAKCIAERLVSPWRLGDKVEVTGMAPEDECEREMFVVIQWQGRDLAVLLAQLEGIAVDDETREAIGDWHYWVARG
jgi:hypothetical protein